METIGEDMTLWAKVSDPPLQLIEILCDTAAELAEKCGVTANTVMGSASRVKNNKRAYSRYIRIEIDEKEEE